MYCNVVIISFIQYHQTSRDAATRRRMSLHPRPLGVARLARRAVAAPNSATLEMRPCHTTALYHIITMVTHRRQPTNCTAPCHRHTLYQRPQPVNRDLLGHAVLLSPRPRNPVALIDRKNILDDSAIANFDTVFITHSVNTVPLNSPLACNVQRFPWSFLSHCRDRLAT